MGAEAISAIAPQGTDEPSGMQHRAPRTVDHFDDVARLAGQRDTCPQKRKEALSERVPISRVRSMHSALRA